MRRKPKCGRTDGRTDGQTDGRTDGQTHGEEHVKKLFSTAVIVNEYTHSTFVRGH